MCLVCDFERENRRFEICVCDFYVYACDCVWICVCVCDFGPKNHKSKFLFLILDWVGHEGRGPQGWVRVPGKIRLVNRLGSGRRSWPVGRVWVWKNPARTWPVVIPNFQDFLLKSHLCWSWTNPSPASPIE